MIPLAIGAGILVGLVFGLVGGGGGLLALPVLVYVLGEPVGPASTASLLVVAVAAAVGVARTRGSGRACWHLALSFAPTVILGSVLGAFANHWVSGPVLILSLVPLLLLSAAATWGRAGRMSAAAAEECPSASPSRVALAGFLVGALTGFLGVGGGFAFVPVLTLFIGMGMHRAVATSLVVISMTALIALVAHLAAGSTIPLGPAATVALGAAIGAALGAGWGARLPQQALARAFALITIVVALALLFDALLGGGPTPG